MEQPDLITLLKCEKFISDEEQFKLDLKKLSSQILVDRLQQVSEVSIAAVSNCLLTNFLLLSYDEKYKKELNILVKQKGLINVLQLEENELFDDSLQKEKEEIKKMQEQKVEYKDNKLYTCKRCDSKKVEVRQNQTRASDEATTAYLICHSCNSYRVLRR